MSEDYSKLLDAMTQLENGLLDPQEFEALTANLNLIQIQLDQAIPPLAELLSALPPESLGAPDPETLAINDLAAIACSFFAVYAQPFVGEDLASALASYNVDFNTFWGQYDIGLWNAYRLSPTPVLDLLLFSSTEQRPHTSTVYAMLTMGVAYSVAFNDRELTPADVKGLLEFKRMFELHLASGNPIPELEELISSWPIDDENRPLEPVLVRPHPAIEQQRKEAYGPAYWSCSD